MSGSDLSLLAANEELPPVSPEKIAAARASLLASMRQTPNAIASMPLTIAAPDPQLPGPLGYVPGAGLVEATGGLAHYVGSKLADLGNALIRPGSMAEKWGLHIPQPPEFLQNMGERFEENRGQVSTGLDKYTGGILQQPDLTTPEGQAADTWGSAIGAGVGFAPASMLSAVPRGLKTLTSLITAPREHMLRNIPLNVGLTGGQELADAAFHPAQANATETATPPAASTVVAQATQPQPLPVPPIPPASKDNDPLGLYSGTKQGGSDVQVKLPFGEDTAGPTFTQQGNTGTSVAETLVDLGLVFGAIAGGRALYRRGAAIHSAARDARLNNPEYAAQVNDYHNDVIKRGPGTGTIGSPEEVNAPLPQGNVVRKTVTYLADKISNDAAKNQDYINLTADNPTAAERLTSQLGNLHDTRLQRNQMLHFLTTGVDRQTGIKMPSVTKLADDYGRLPDDRRTELGMALRAQNEIQNRTNNAIDFVAANPGKTPTVADIHHDFIGKPSEELRAIAAKIQSDPVYLDLATRYKGITDGMIDIGNHPTYSFFDNNEARDLKSKRSHMVPEFDVKGMLKHPFGPRDTSAYTGQAHGGVDPVYALAAHVEQMYPLFQLEQFKQQLYKHYTGVMARPGAPQFMTELERPTGPHASYYPQGMTEFGGEARDPIVTLRNNGVKHIRIDNTDVYNMMKGNSIGAARVYLDAMDMGRRAYQKGTTGLVSTITGRAMPLRNAVFTSFMAPANSPRGMAGGLLDRTLQRATGRTSTITRGLDMPLNVARLPITALQSGLERLAGTQVGDRVANRLADVLHPQATNVFNTGLRSMIDPSIVDTMHQSIKSYYANSTVAFARERGIAGQSSPIHTEAPGFVTGSKASRVGDRGAGVRLETARVAPRAFINGRWAAPRAAGIRIHNVLGDIFNSISDLGHEQWLRTNRGNPNISPERLTYETRNLVGNPSRMGSSKIVQGMSSLLPYTNVSMQGIGRAMRAVGDSPVRTPLTIAMGLGTAAALSILTHMRSAAHMDYLQNQVSLQQRAANIQLGMNDDPSKPTAIPIPQELRPAYAYMLDLVSKAINVIGARHDPEIFKAVWDGLTHFLGGHITNSNMDSIIHGGVDMADFINVPPIVGRVDWNAVIHGRGLQDAYHSSVSGVTNPAPGEGSDAPLDSANGQLFERLLSNTIGAVAHAMEIPNAAIRYHAQGHPFLDSLGMAGHDWIQTSRESNPILNNMVWETQVRLSMNPPIAEALQPSLDAVKKLGKPVGQSMEGFVGKGPSTQPIPMTTDRAMSQDMLMQQMLMVARGFRSRIDQAMAPITAIRQQMHSVEKTGMDPAERRAWLNDRTRDMADKWKLVDAYVSDLDNAMSNMAGKPVRIEDIDFGKDSTQFR